jgi:hypothetical protein
MSVAELYLIVHYHKALIINLDKSIATDNSRVLAIRMFSSVGHTSRCLLMPSVRSFGRAHGWPGLPRKSLSSATAALALFCTVYPAVARAVPGGSLGAAPARGLASAAAAGAKAAGAAYTLPPGYEAAVLLESFPAGNQSKVECTNYRKQFDSYLQSLSPRCPRLQSLGWLGFGCLH